MGRRKQLTQGKLEALKNQRFLDFEDDKIWESRIIALARYKIVGKFTRQIVKILVLRARTCDVYNEEQKVYITEIDGADAPGYTYKAGKAEALKMGGDGLLVEVIKGENVVFFNFFGGRVEYDDKGHFFRVTLNPKLKAYYNALGQQFTVLMLSEYLRLSSPFYKDLYEWLIAHQGSKDFKFEILMENFCTHFNCEKSLNGHRDDVYNRILSAKEEIESLTELRFSVTPHYKGGGAIRKGTLDKLIFNVHTGPYYLAIQEEKKKREMLAQQLAEYETTAEFQQVAENLGEDQQLPMDKQMLNAIERKIEQEKEKNKVHVAANLDDIPDDKWNEMISEAPLGDLYIPSDEEENFVIEDEITEEEIEEARREMEEALKNDKEYIEAQRMMEDLLKKEAKEEKIELIKKFENE